MTSAPRRRPPRPAPQGRRGKSSGSRPPAGSSARQGESHQGGDVVPTTLPGASEPSVLDNETQVVLEDDADCGDIIGYDPSELSASHVDAHLVNLAADVLMPATATGDLLDEGPLADDGEPACEVSVEAASDGLANASSSSSGNAGDTETTIVPPMPQVASRWVPPSTPLSSICLRVELGRSSRRPTRHYVVV